jgi:hypothetical protein
MMSEAWTRQGNFIAPGEIAYCRRTLPGHGSSP